MVGLPESCTIELGAVGHDNRCLDYYRRVKRFVFSPLHPAILLAACNSGSHPPRIGNAAPDFTITDSQRTVTLSQLRGKPVCSTSGRPGVRPASRRCPRWCSCKSRWATKLPSWRSAKMPTMAPTSNSSAIMGSTCLRCAIRSEKLTKCTAPSSFRRPLSSIATGNRAQIHRCH